MQCDDAIHTVGESGRRSSVIDSVETAVVLTEVTQHVRPHPFSDLTDTRGFA